MDIPVTVSVTDLLGNVTTCISTVSIGGLPCGWTEGEAVGDCIGTASYDPDADQFTVTSEDCHNAVSQNSDEYGYAIINVCGDVTITAEVTSLTSAGAYNGWAGVTMRETNDPASKMVTLMTNFIASHRLEYRSITGGALTAQLTPALNRQWLRIRRTGNTFRGYSSFNGGAWVLKFAITVPMDECIQIGLVVNSSVGSGDHIATFDNVSVTGGGVGFQADNTGNVAPTLSQARFSVFPNPSGGLVNLSLEDYLDQDVIIDLMSPQGELVERIKTGIVEDATERFDLSRLPAGMYFVRLRQADGTIQTQQLILQPRP